MDDHDPFGHVRLSPHGGGWVCGLCGVGVVNRNGKWEHVHK